MCFLTSCGLVTDTMPAMHAVPLTQFIFTIDSPEQLLPDDGAAFDEFGLPILAAEDRRTALCR